MFKAATDWNPKQALLKEIIKNKDRFPEAIQLCQDMHRFVHQSSMIPVEEVTLEDELWEGLAEEDLNIMPTVKDVTIAWNLWHLTRIEDLTINILVADGPQVFNDKWLKKLNVTVKDTGNAMADEEILSLSDALNKEELKNYRNAVGRQTQQILSSLSLGDIKRKVSTDGLNRIKLEGGVTNAPDSLWLLDFWGKKDVAGILQMPITRHQIVHLNDSLKLKEKIKRLKK
jgi:hypothetical protein